MKRHLFDKQEISIEPAEGETAFLSALLKAAGGAAPREQAEAAARAYRVLTSAPGALEAFAKAIDVQPGGAADPVYDVVDAPELTREEAIALLQGGGTLTPTQALQLMQAWAAADVPEQGPTTWGQRLAGAAVEKGAVAEIQKMALADRKVNDARALEDIDRLATSIQKSDSSLTKEAAWLVAARREPDLYARHLRHLSRQAGGHVDADLLRGPDPGLAGRQLARKADEIRKADETLTAEQAMVKAYRENPELYAELTQAPAATETPDDQVRKERIEKAEAVLEQRVRAIQAADGKITRASAIVKAYRDDPDLYMRHRGEA